MLELAASIGQDAYASRRFALPSNAKRRQDLKYVASAFNTQQNFFQISAATGQILHDTQESKKMIYPLPPISLRSQPRIVLPRDHHTIDLRWDLLRFGQEWAEQGRTVR